jgi:hypothetical protein
MYMLKKRYIFRHFEKVKTTAINLNFGFEITKQYKTEAPYLAPPYSVYLGLSHLMASV